MGEFASLNKQCLPVMEEADPGDLRAPPVSAEQYILRVRLESQGYPNVASIDSLLDSNTVVSPSVTDSYPGSKPTWSSDWEENILYKFNTWKSTFKAQSESIRLQPCNIELRRQLQSRLPKNFFHRMKEEKYWKDLCCTSYTTSGLDSGGSKDKINAAMLYNLDNTDILRIFTWFIKWLDDIDILGDRECYSLFLLLLALDDLLNFDQVFILRQLCRKLISMRSGDASTNVSLEVIISIINLVFGQKDLF
ncbi:hypothetical protein AX774_g4317 [Zancudomyces culisetae]|uniref:Gem-associated protein 2 n=1 Tax=Zancudomyces culisetae TaxID=1213189 RepID=A0A1R1PMK8_ZANCU|nr:hypothetical protein AX774_g4317 [Zancudomyces culisetae]|eukprot:OMH82200.1 hypothetical protein AX774_g4317 [Zancudomyces culisetae]